LISGIRFDDLVRDVLEHAGSLRDFEAIETALKSALFQEGARALERALDQVGTDDPVPTYPCFCEKEARHAGVRPKTLTTVLGPVKLIRAWYHCDSCHHGFAPKDRSLGIEGANLSPGVVRLTGYVGASLSFEEGSTLLKELAGISMGAKQVERIAEELGREIAQDEQEVVNPDPRPLPHTLYLGMDGSGIPMRLDELAGRLGKQIDGSSKTREVKEAVVWSAETLDRNGVAVRDKGSVTYSAAIESAASSSTEGGLSDFARRVEREARRRGFDRAKRCVVIGDGAHWIWNTAEELFPDAICIVDRFHVKQHLSDVGKSLFGSEGNRASDWSKARHEELDSGKIDEIINALAIYSSRFEEAEKCIGYLENNRSRMRYPEFRAQGLCTSSGVVEAGCKVAIGTRLKRAGMHWSAKGANAIIALRCTILSGRYEDFWERRALKQAA